MYIHIEKKVLLKRVTNHNGTSFFIPHNWEGSLTSAPKFKHGASRKMIYRKATEEEISKYKENKI